MLTHDEIRNATDAELTTLIQERFWSANRTAPVWFDPGRDWTDAWKLLHDGLIEWGNASVSWDMEDYGREPGDVCTVEIGGWRVMGEFRTAVCKAWLLMHDLDPNADDERGTEGTG